jgi:hypothetical protein
MMKILVDLNVPLNKHSDDPDRPVSAGYESLLDDQYRDS